VTALDYIQTAKNLADQFTKGLSQSVIDNVSKELVLRPLASQDIVATCPMCSQIL
jgi:hypothetical protein